VVKNANAPIISSGLADICGTIQGAFPRIYRLLSFRKYGSIAPMLEIFADREHQRLAEYLNILDA